MERKLLFINHRPEVVKEFTFAMEHQEFMIETASNGYDAAVLLKKQEYPVVILGMVLDGYNGEQILTYLNKHCPRTVCIVYTTVLTPGQLKFLVNERKVFRIFLRPINYYREFPQAIEEAFLEYGLQEKQVEEKLELQKAYCQKREELFDLAETIKRQRRGFGKSKKFLNFLLEQSLIEKKEILSSKEYQELFQAEIDLVSQYERFRGKRFRNLITVEEELLQEFASLGREITFDVKDEVSGLLPEPFLRKFKTIMCVLLRRYMLLTRDYQAYIQIKQHSSSTTFIIEIIIKMPEEIFKECSKITAEAVRNNIIRCMIESIAEEFVRIEKEDCIKYYIEIS